MYMQNKNKKQKNPKAGFILRLWLGGKNQRKQSENNIIVQFLLQGPY